MTKEQQLVQIIHKMTDKVDSQKITPQLLEELDNKELGDNTAIIHMGKFYGVMKITDWSISYPPGSINRLLTISGIIVANLLVEQ